MRGKKKNIKIWKKRANKSGENVIARIYSVSPKHRGRFYLRLLLLHVRGATCFDELRDVRLDDGTTKRFDTYEEACRERGLLADDME